MLGNCGGSFLSKRDCLYCTGYWKGRVLFIQQKKMELKSQICSSFPSLWTSKSHPVGGHLLLIPSVSKHPHATTPFFCSLDISPTVSPQHWQGGSSLACLCLLAQISWNKAHKWPKITAAFPRAGQTNQFTEYFFLSVLSALSALWLDSFDVFLIWCVATLSQLSFI